MKLRVRFSIGLLMFPVLLGAQTKNPDISVITDFRTFAHNDESAPAEKNALNLDLSEIEAAVQGYLNPYARADIFIAKHGVEGPIDIEEAYATFLRGLPLGLNIKAGKYLLDFSKLNLLHPHAYNFIERPLVQTVFFGDDGFNDTGINANLLLPTGDIYTNLSVNILKGDFLKSHDHSTEANHTDEEETAERQPLAYSARLTAHVQTSDYSNLELGISSVTGIHDSHENLRMILGGLDLKYKWKPDRYRSLTFQAEALLNKRDIHESNNSSVISGGFFSYFTYQFKQRWNVGMVGEWTQSPESTDETYWSAGLFAGFSPMEETSVIRILLRQEKQPETDNFFKILAQLIFSLGPHKAHVF